MDESGGRGQPSPMVMGGLLMAAEDWMKFTEDWREALDRLPRVWRFKSSDLTGNNPKGPWYGIRADERRAKLHTLAGVLRRHRPRVIRTSVDTVRFAETIGRLMTQPMDDPYFYLFFNTIEIVASHLVSEGQRERFEIVFDDNAIMAPRVKRWYPMLREMVERLSAAGPRWAEIASILPIDPLFRTDDALLPLQGADLIAGALRGDMRGRYRLQWLRPELPPLTWEYDLDVRQLGEILGGLRGAQAAALEKFTDTERYAQILGLDDDPSRWPAYLRPRAREYAASRARIPPSVPQAPEPAPHR